VRITLFPFRLHRKSLILALVLGFTGFSASGQGKGISMDEAVQIAQENNHELRSVELMMNQADKLTSAAWDIPKTSVYHSFDENNIAVNGIPLKVFGVQQTFQFPTVYSSQRSTNKSELRLIEISLEIKRMKLAMEVSQAYCNLVFLRNKHEQYLYLDSLYSGFATAAEKRYQSGESNYLENLTASSKQQQIRTQLNQNSIDIGSAYEELKKLLQIDSFQVAGDQTPAKLNFIEKNLESNPGLLYFSELSKLSDSKIRWEKNNLLPDLNLEYFQGRNSGPGAIIYPGYQFGISIPIYFGAQNARIQASKIGKEVSYHQEENYRLRLESSVLQLKAEINRLDEAINLYESSGRNLSAEIIKTAWKSYQSGDIDFFNLIQSLETASEIEITHLENINKYNQKVLEYNYLVF
jgi:cobalt-zinc-cadmium resistance protein CzcA